LTERAPQDLKAAVVEWEKNRASHLGVQVIEPQTIAYALTDSPLGLASWILERRWTWSDARDRSAVMDLDDLITVVMIYWVTGTGGTAARFYAEANRNPWKPSHDRHPTVEAPSGVSLFGANNPPGYDSSWIAGYYNLVFQRDHDLGGHFPPIEQPSQLVEDLRDMFRPLR
jgi:microsomal epoxide hydrolase